MTAFHARFTTIGSKKFGLQWKFKKLAGNFDWGNKANHCWVMLTNSLCSKVCWQCPAMFCLYTASKLSLSLFEFSLKMKVMGSNPGRMCRLSSEIFFTLTRTWNYFALISISSLNEVRRNCPNKQTIQPQSKLFYY